MNKTNWTEADFESLGWHDNHVHGFTIREGEYGAGLLILDLDYICEWLCGSDKTCTFMLAPADLTFHEVTNLRINVDGTGISLGPLSIGEVTREVATHTDRHTSYRWRIVFNFPQGEISFEASGFTQALRAAPIHSPQQCLSAEERRGKGAGERDVAADGATRHG